jgi:hypothetical protein
VRGYLARLSATTDEYNAQFYARADNLADWLAIVEKRLGSLSQRLSASVGQDSRRHRPGATPNAQQSTPQASPAGGAHAVAARSTTCSTRRAARPGRLLHFLRAVEHDFEPVLRDKNAPVSACKQIIRELEETQHGLGSPVVHERFASSACSPTIRW